MHSLQNRCLRKANNDMLSFMRSLFRGYVCIWGIMMNSHIQPRLLPSWVGA